jgi:hypothetical protein
LIWAYNGISQRRIGFGSISYLLLRGEVIYYVEKLPDLLRCLALNHVGDGLAAHVTVGKIRNAIRVDFF